LKQPARLHGKAGLSYQWRDIMYKVYVDNAKKLVKLEASGFFQLEEAKEVLLEFEKAMSKFRPKEAVLLTDVSTLKVSSPELVSYIEKIQVLGKEHFRKFASIQASGIASIQLKRIAKHHGTDDTIERFNSEEEAMKFLFG
jgi:hypothetical protein